MESQCLTPATDLELTLSFGGAKPGREDPSFVGRKGRGIG